ncbi:MAG: hypothetical protein EBR81_09800 [Proteobacteria bacterium]|nr:hypothetical protein [Pseudomonadota bacterium]
MDDMRLLSHARFRDFQSEDNLNIPKIRDLLRSDQTRDRRPWTESKWEFIKFKNHVLSLPHLRQSFCESFPHECLLSLGVIFCGAPQAPLSHCPFFPH